MPLSRQSVAILRELHALTGAGRYVLPGARDRKRPMSEATFNAALRRLGYDTRTEITGHGFRAMARTILHEELDQKPEVIEHQLAHTVPDCRPNFRGFERVASGFALFGDCWEPAMRRVCAPRFVASWSA